MRAQVRRDDIHLQLIVLLFNLLDDFQAPRQRREKVPDILILDQAELSADENAVDRPDREIGVGIPEQVSE